MCNFVYLASPLTLSEVRSMLPAGLTADGLPKTEQQALLNLHYDAQDAMRILHGGCSCDLIRDRQPDPGADEVIHRQRYRQLGYDRSRMIRYLERHRLSAKDQRHRPPGYWGEAFNAFVVEHARNAGPTLFYQHFSHDGLQNDLGLAAAMRHVQVREVQGPVSDWLPEQTPIMVG
jgi:hypothetical protein